MSSADYMPAALANAFYDPAIASDFLLTPYNLDYDPLDLIETNRVSRPLVELRRPWRLVRRDLLNELGLIAP
jgi:hypothetical protein